MAARRGWRRKPAALRPAPTHPWREGSAAPRSLGLAARTADPRPAPRPPSPSPARPNPAASAPALVFRPAPTYTWHVWGRRPVVPANRVATRPRCSAYRREGVAERGRVSDPGRAGLAVAWLEPYHPLRTAWSSGYLTDFPADSVSNVYLCTDWTPRSQEVGAAEKQDLRPGSCSGYIGQQNSADWRFPAVAGCSQGLPHQAVKSLPLPLPVLTFQAKKVPADPRGSLLRNQNLLGKN